MTTGRRRTPRARVVICDGLPAPAGSSSTGSASDSFPPGEPPASATLPRHCDDYIHDPAAPLCLRAWLFVHRLPAVDEALLRGAGISPRLYADHRGRRVRVTMASRLGDVGVSLDHAREYGYDERVSVADLSGFSPDP